MVKKLMAADLYCGAGGFSEGLEEACRQLGYKLHLVAINHWDDAISTHRLNHPEAIQLKEDLDGVDPRVIVPGGYLDIMIGAPECTHHANARGGKPRNNQSRMQPWTMVRWASSIYISTLVVENVKEMMTWGPLDSKGNPIKRLAGKEFEAWINALKALNYRVEYRLLNASDYGSAQSRERFFLIAHKGTCKIKWPEPTHGDVDERQPRLFGVVKPRRTAAEIIDFGLPMHSIFDPSHKPLSPNTLKRIEAGLRKFAGLSFILPNEGYFGGNQPRGLNEVFPTIMAARETGKLVQPILVQFNGNPDHRTTSMPITGPLGAVVASGNHFAVADPFMVRLDYKIHGKPEANTVFNPLHPMPTLMTKSNMGLAGFVLNNRGGEDGYLRGTGFNEQIGTVTTDAPMELVKMHTQPIIVKSYTGSDAISVTEQLPTVTAGFEHFALSKAFMTLYHGASYPGGERVRPVTMSMPTVDTNNRVGFALPWLVKFYGQSIGQSLDQSIGTIIGNEHFGLVLVSLEDGQQWVLDILFRMFEPHEYARAQSFAPGYHFYAKAKRRTFKPVKRGEYTIEGPKKNIVKMIGNAVDGCMATALCVAAITTMKG